MKQSIIDTDILSEFLRGNPKVISKVDELLIGQSNFLFSLANSIKLK